VIGIHEIFSGDMGLMRPYALGDEYGGVVRSTVYDMHRLTPGTRIEGPVIVEEKTSTTIPSKAMASVDELHNIVITLR
jgi:N-methylhydantoinase A/oxoprolinase/acetone carboxylase beta subunit